MDLLKLLEVLVEFDTVNDPDNGRMPDPGVVDFVEGVLNGLGVKTGFWLVMGIGVWLASLVPVSPPAYYSWHTLMLFRLYAVSGGMTRLG